MRLRKEALYVILLAPELDVLLDAQLARQALGWAAVWTVADHPETRGHLFYHLRQNADAIEHAFHRTEIGYVHEPEFRRGIARAIGFDVDEVVDDADFVADIEDVNCLLSQVVADAG